MITVFADGNRSKASAKRSMDDDGWVVELTEDPGTDYEESRRLYFPDSGGSWWLKDDGSIGKQATGTCDVMAPKKSRRMRTFLKNLC